MMIQLLLELIKYIINHPKKFYTYFSLPILTYLTYQNYKNTKTLALQTSIAISNL